MSITNNSNIDLNLLKSLKVLLDECHVGRAAQKMNITQSAMSQTLARLRIAFDDPLFVRNARGLSPTSRALELSGQLNFVLNEIETLLAPKQFDASQLQRNFHIHTHEFVIETYLSKILGLLSSQAPHVTIDIQTIHPRSNGMLDAGDIDLIIGSGLEAKPRFIQQRYREEKLFCLLDEDHPVLEQWNATHLFQYPHIKSSLLSEQDDPITRYGKSHNLPPRQVVMRIQALNLQLPIIKGTQMIAFLPQSLAEIGKNRYGLTIREIPFQTPDLVIKGVWHERSKNDPAHHWLRQNIKQAMSP